MIKAAIISGNNPAVGRLVNLLHSHPDVELVAFVNEEQAGSRLDDVYPALLGETEARITSNVDLSTVDVVFIADEPGAARRFLKNNNISNDLRIVDMTGDFALPSDENDFVQGIAELNRKSMVRGATKVSLTDPATQAVALGLLPLAKNLMLNSEIRTAIVSDSPGLEQDAMKGRLTASAFNDGLKAALTSLQSSFDSQISGVKFEGDIASGVTAVTTISNNIDLDELRRIYDEFYDDHSFTFIVDTVPDASDVRGTNKCLIHLAKEGDKLVITTVLDTDVKGTSGNAVHAMNLLFGLLEKVGL